MISRHINLDQRGKPKILANDVSDSENPERVTVQYQASVDGIKATDRHPTTLLVV